MKKVFFIISMTLAALSQSMTAAAQSLSATVKNTPEKADTLISYSIDGQHIKHFSGKELEGKTIKQYEIRYAFVPANNTVIESHLIQTTNPTKAKASEPHYILDGKEISKEEMNKISPDKIKEVSVFKAGSKGVQQYGKDGDYIIITLKK